MSKDKETTKTESSQTRERTPEQIELDRLALDRAKASQEGLMGTEAAGLNLAELLLKGQNLPGFLGTLPGGISEEAVAQQAANLAKQNMAGFQNLGIAESGVAFRETSKDIANNLLFPTEQFNIGNLQNLLNLALSGQAQVQAPILGSQSDLGARLSQFGRTTGTGRSTVIGMNPFLRSFQTSLGEGLGKSASGGITGMFSPAP